MWDKQCILEGLYQKIVYKDTIQYGTEVKKKKNKRQKKS